MDNKTIKYCLIAAVTIIGAYVLYTYRNQFFATTKSYLYLSERKVKGNPFSLSTTQRVNSYIRHATKKAISEPRYFNYTSSNINQSLINQFLLAARFALVAYETDPILVQQQCEKLGASFKGQVNNGNCYIFVGDLGYTQVIGIQGTEFVPNDWNIYQVWSDLSITPRFIVGSNINDPYAKYVHSGFYDDLVALWPQVQPLVDFSRPIWICAHSLGAVRASLARYLIPTGTYVRITNFGAPRGANAAYWDYTTNNSNTVVERVVAENDFAPDWIPGLPYYHPNEYFYWLHDGQINHVNQRNWLNVSFDDHSIENSYIPKLLTLATKTF